MGMEVAAGLRQRPLEECRVESDCSRPGDCGTELRVTGVEWTPMEELKKGAVGSLRLL